MKNIVNVKEVKVSTKTEQKNLAASISYSLKEGNIVKCIALVQAIMVLTRAICLVNIFKGEDLKLDFQPSLEYINCNDLEIHNAVVFVIKIK